MPAPPLSTVLDRIGQTQPPLGATAAVLLGVAVLAVVALPATWLVVQHVDTMAHEGAHALVGSSMGGTVQSVTMKPDGGGLTRTAFLPSTGGFLPGLAGYFGPSAFGLAAAKLISTGHIVAVLWLAMLLLAILLAMIRNPFGAVAVVVTGLVIYHVARYAAIGTETVAAYVISWFLLLSGIRVLLKYSGREGDASALARTTHVPGVVWVGIWLAGSTVALAAGGSLLV